MVGIMIDTKTLIGMRDELEKIQGGVGLGESAHNAEHISDESSQEPTNPSSITSDMFGSNGPSLGASVLRAMGISQGS